MQKSKVNSYLLTTVLQIPHQGLLDAVEFCKLYVDGFTCPFEILGTFRQVLATLDTGRSDRKGTLLNGSDDGRL